MDLKDKTALITGSSRGIGAAIALKFAKEGANIVLNYKENEVAAWEIEKKILETGAKCVKVKADVGKSEEIKSLFQKSVETFGEINILVNNFSLQGNSNFFTSPESFWQKHFELTFMSAVRCSLEFCNLNENKKGKIVNISSVFGGITTHGAHKFIHYSAMKAALNNFTKNLAINVAPNILVNSVSPGYTKTDLWNGLSQEVLESCANEMLIKRFIKPEEIADTVIFLAKNDAVTGEILNVDGGLSSF